MLVVGAKGFAKEVLEILYQNEDLDDLVFYDDISTDIGTHLYDTFPIIRNREEAAHYFKTVDNRFTIGIGNPKLRMKLNTEFVKIGGIFTSVISKQIDLGNFGVSIGSGSVILSGTKISNDSVIGKGVILYYNSIVTHDVVIGDFVEISPNVALLGRCTIGNESHIGAGSIVLPNVNIGSNVTVGAGAVVIKDLEDNCIAVGIPAKIIKKK